MRPFCTLILLTWCVALSVHEAGAETYTVKKGDSLYTIAKKFKTSADDLRKMNNLATDKLRPGAVLTLPSSERNVRTDKPRAKDEALAKAEGRRKDPSRPGDVPKQPFSSREKFTHTVKKGDTLSSIARTYSTTVAELTSINNLAAQARLKPGQQLIVRSVGPRIYTVKKADTLWKIARRFDMDSEEIMAVNELDSEEVKPGQKLFLDLWEEGSDLRDYAPILSQARITEEIQTISESPALADMSVKDRIILFARKMLDIPYKFGGSSFMGIDCSAYVQKVFGFLDVALPRTAREQFHLGEPVSKDDLSIGDLVFFRTYASFPSHVGIYLGNNLFIHASSKGKKVTIDSLETPYYYKRFIGAKRLYIDETSEGLELNNRG